MPLRQCRNLKELKALPEWNELEENHRIFLTKAYRDNVFLEKVTDGISWIDELGFDKPGHPIGVGHDWITQHNAMSMKAADLWFRSGLVVFGFPGYAKAYYYGLRTFGIPYRLGGRAWRWIKTKLAGTARH